MVSNHEWLISTLRALNEADPAAIGLSEYHFKILEQEIAVDPNLEQTPY